MERNSLIKLNNVSVHYDGLIALDGCTVDIGEGQTFAIIGPNGAGKSTVLKAIFGLVKLVSGSVYFNNKKIIPSPHSMTRNGVSFVSQDNRVFKSLTVRENLGIGSIFLKSKAREDEIMSEIYSIFPVIKKKLNCVSSALSGGEQQMVAIARALISDPAVLILDEPTLGLSPKLAEEIFKKIVFINKEHKRTIIFVEHNIKSALAIADEVYVLNFGKVVAHGSAENVQKSPLFKELFMMR